MPRREDDPTPEEALRELGRQVLKALEPVTSPVIAFLDRLLRRLGLGD